jgi:hypothetical protein
LSRRRGSGWSCVRYHVLVLAFCEIEFGFRIGGAKGICGRAPRQIFRRTSTALLYSRHRLTLHGRSDHLGRKPGFPSMPDRMSQPIIESMMYTQSRRHKVLLGRWSGRGRRSDLELAEFRIVGWAGTGLGLVRARASIRHACQVYN